MLYRESLHMDFIDDRIVQRNQRRRVVSPIEIAFETTTPFGHRTAASSRSSAPQILPAVSQLSYPNTGAFQSHPVPGDRLRIRIDQQLRRIEPHTRCSGSYGP